MSEQDADGAAIATYRTSWGDGWIRFDSDGPVEMGLPGQASSGGTPRIVSSGDRAKTRATQIPTSPPAKMGAAVT